MNSKRFISFSGLTLFLSLFLSACGGGGGGSSNSNSGGDTPVVISGVASKNLISGGTVKVSSLSTDGAIGSQLGTATTQSSGAFSVNIGTYSGNIIVEVTGGTYKDEATGNTVNNTTTLRAAVLNVAADRSVAVTPLTEIAVQKAGTLTSSNVEAANTLVSNMIGGVDITTTLPVDVTSAASSATAAQAQKDYSLMLAAVSQMVKDGYAADVASAITAIKNDLSDNQLNSTGANISAALSTFIASANNQSGVDLSGTQLDNYITTYTNSTMPDTTPPMISSTSPVNGATGVAVNSTITATFSEAMDCSTITTSSFTLKDSSNNSVAGSITTCNGAAATFTPSANLASNNSYTATITTAVKDAAGNAMTSIYTWSFTTGSSSDITPPTVISINPTNGSTGIATNSSITATFSEIMEVSTVTNVTFTVKDIDNHPVSGSVTYSGTTATFTPASNLALTTYTATITTGAKDISGNGLAANYSWSFSTKQWANTTPGSSADVSAIAVDSLTPTTMYAGTMNTGFYKSTDGGASWSNIGLPTNSSISSLTMNTMTPTTLYGFVWGGLSGISNGVYKSTDGGVTWVIVNSGLPIADNSRQLSPIAIDPVTPSTLYVEAHYTNGSQGSALFRSTDSGGNWSQINMTGLNSTYISQLVVNPMTPTIIYAATNSGLYKSIDSGLSWNPVSIGHTTLYIYSIVFDPFTPTTLFAVTNGGPYKSTDNGATWVSTPTQGPQGNQQTMSIVIDTSNPGTIYACGTKGEVFRSSNSGDSWRWLSTVPDGLDSYSLAINTTSHTLFARTIGHLYRLDL